MRAITLAPLSRTALFLLLGWGLGSAASAQAMSMSERRNCVPPPGGMLNVSEDSIGSLGIDEELGRLRDLCVSARDTIVRLRVDVPNDYPGLAFHFDSLLVIALQYRGSSLDLRRPADVWMIFGGGGTIQHKVALSASWSSLRTALGMPQANARGVLVVRFCSFPNAVMTLNADPRAVTTRGGRVDVTTIPASATIHHLVIMTRSLASHLQGC